VIVDTSFVLDVVDDVERRSRRNENSKRKAFRW